VPRPERYVERIAAGESPVAGQELLDPATEAFDRLGLALRTRAGAALGPLADRAALDELTEAGLVEVAADRIVLTPAGRLLASEVTLRLDPRDARGGAPGTRYH
jgi:oxygen-independent coproporphyrinogen-3 oxidase